MIRLFNISNNVVVPSEHCYTLSTLKDIMEAYPEDHCKIYQYLFYMTCPNPELNPFFNTKEEDKESLILSQLNPEFSVEDEMIVNALVFCRTLYETATLRAFNGIKSMLDRLATYMETTSITHGRDGNITALVNAAAKFDDIRAAYRGAYKDLMEEQGVETGRGGQKIAYDQK